MARCLMLVMAAKKRATSSGLRTTGRVRGCLTGGMASEDVVAAQGDTVEEPQGGASLLIVAEGDTPLLDEVEQVGADVFRAEVLRRRLEVTCEASDAWT